MVSFSPEPPPDPTHDTVSSQNAVYMPAIADSDDDDFDDDEGVAQIAVAIDGNYEPISDTVDTGSDFSSEPGSSDSASEDEEGDVHDTASGTTPGLQPPNPEESVSLSSGNVWEDPAIPGPTIEMDEEQVAQVLAAMSNITLPANAIPEWASSVPEESWRQTLLERIQSLRKTENGQK